MSFESSCVTKEEYEEVGSNACRKKFNRGAKVALYSASNMGSASEEDRNEDDGGGKKSGKEKEKEKDDAGGRAGRSKTKGNAKGTTKKANSTSVEPEPEPVEEQYEGRPGTRRRPPRGSMKG